MTRYIQLRLTLPFELDNSMNVEYRNGSNTWIKKLIRDINMALQPDEYIYQKEKYNKYGEETKHHYHACLYRDKGFKNARGDDLTKVSLQKKIQRFWESNLDLKWCGNKAYSVQFIDEPNDLRLWYSYCLKQISQPNRRPYVMYVKMFENEIVYEVARGAAYAKWIETQEIFKKTRENKEWKATLNNRLNKYMLEKQVKDKKTFIIEMINFYLKTGDVIPFSKIEDKYLTYKIASGLTTPEEYAEKYINETT